MLRSQCFAIDLVILGWLGLMLLLTLSAAVFGDGQYTAHLLLSILPMLLGYLALQRAAKRSHDMAQRGETAPIWLRSLSLLGMVAPLVVMPLTFLLVGELISGNGWVPSIAGHANFDPNFAYDPDHAGSTGLAISEYGAATAWDLKLKAADIAIFGAYPPAVLREMRVAWLTGVLQLCYCFYYLGPVLAAIPLLIQKRWREFRLASALIGFCLLLTYLGYFFFPSTGPRFEGGVEAWVPSEDAWFGARGIYLAINGAETFRWNAFPSGHVAVSLASMLVALRFNRKLGLVMVLPTLGLCFATVYLGYHYVTDVIGGLACTALTMIFFPKWFSNWEAKLWRSDSGKSSEAV